MSGNSDWCNRNQHTACRYDHCACICHLDEEEETDCA